MTTETTGPEPRRGGASAPPPTPTPPDVASGSERGAHGEHGHSAHLVPQDAREKLSLRLQHALNSFVDSPQQSVADVDAVLDEAASHITRAVEECRRMTGTGGMGTERGEDTEHLRLALRRSRDLAERLIKI